MRRAVWILLAFASMGCELLTRPGEVHFVPANDATLDDVAADTADLGVSDAVDDGTPQDVCTTACSGVCVDLDTDIHNCSRCGRECPGGANADPTCTSGNCGLACHTGFGDCDSNAGTGCEASLGDPAHCGSCSNACPARPNATPTCSDGMCGLACNPGFADCDGDPLTGCETPLGIAAHCSSCTACPTPMNAVPACSGGACTFTCAPDFADCDGNPANGCEASLTSDAHCGSCANACPATTSCHAYATVTGCCSPLTTGSCTTTFCNAPEPMCHPVGVMTTCCTM